jgi:hypothetical protein
MQFQVETLKVFWVLEKQVDKVCVDSLGDASSWPATEKDFGCLFMLDRALGGRRPPEAHAKVCPVFWTFEGKFSVYPCPGLGYSRGGNPYPCPDFVYLRRFSRTDLAGQVYNIIYNIIIMSTRVSM